MKASSANAKSKPLDRQTAWACAITNAVTVPGLGSLAGGRRIGYLQCVLALGGMGVSILGLVLVVRQWMANDELPDPGSPGFLLSLAGILFFAAAWFWALLTSISLHREARANERLSSSKSP